jgi:hypothetical protein
MDTGCKYTFTGRDLGSVLAQVLVPREDGELTDGSLVYAGTEYWTDPVALPSSAKSLPGTITVEAVKTHLGAGKMDFSWKYQVPRAPAWSRIQGPLASSDLSAPFDQETFARVGDQAYFNKQLGVGLLWRRPDSNSMIWFAKKTDNRLFPRTSRAVLTLGDLPDDLRTTWYYAVTTFSVSHP